ncbi:hypothetical protein L486_00768 [Kwoniella mangroviensis CBS 10435]|uniref:Uncharacterized protein n=1 Tax=Kwoniella mangroviensis CBS 10435 TaxID=1331196 RepID=A0A1B9J0D2_9TREE|nr:uncharacterized protein I203_04301 [Kwoniella mangroviensis CBS 8507]OCF61124.1 hypothetical protein L486_00768 [Kwoniella mangroviensis CBS 10435]OCF66725.1 hypothetical protein I203_04301 [Kwoniella mangroviensis CBS 8507]
MLKGPSLQHFIVRAEMIQAYRSAVRATRPLPDPNTRRETLDFLRADLERLRGEYDLNKLKSNLSHFNRTLKQMLPSIGLNGLTSDEVGKGTRLTGQKRTVKDLLS